MLKNLHRRKKGQSMVVLVVFLIVFFVLLLGMAAFEFGRYSLCAQQFQHCVDIAALGGAAGLASAQNTNQASAQSIAISTAQWVMERNYVLDTPLATRVTFTSSAASPPTPTTKNRANINFTWLDPETGLPTGVPGDQKVFKIQGAYAYPPIVGNWIGLGPSALLRCTANGNGGGTQLDVMLCFDVSGSIDDSTKTTFVDRYTNGTFNQYRAARQGTVYANCGTSSDTGTGLNACYPQNLGADNFACTYVAARRGQTQGAPAPANGATTGGRYSDIVVNLDENDVYGGGTFGGLPFPNIGTLVEAARGNLESIAVANAAQVNYGALGVTPQSGYYRTYWEQANEHRHPLIDAQKSAANFFYIMNNSVNAHFGLVAFSGTAGSNVSGPAIAGGANHIFPFPVANGNIPLSASVTGQVPLVPLSTVPGSAGSQFTQVSSKLPLAPTLQTTVLPQALTAEGGTDMNGALTRSLQQLLPAARISGGLGRQRTGATPAIIMFTDGRPNGNSGLGDANGVGSTATAATNGVKIYCIGLAQIPAIVGPMNAVLGPMAANTGGKLYVIPPGTGQAAALDRAFADIARSLVSLTR
ncbi:MAG: VWA domain-containing protein [Leptolyngbya sp.]|nr:VWA domain-containing protein [Candidatus Melainabacteria bacterium]